MNDDTILVATDFSPGSEAALRYALEVVAVRGARVIVLHSFAPAVYPVLDGYVLPAASQVAGQVAAAAKALDAFCASRAPSDGVRIEPRLVEGNAAEEIVRVAGKEGASVIVMGTHGRTGLQRLALGSVAERVMRTASLPVMTIRADRTRVESIFARPPIF